MRTSETYRQNRRNEAIRVQKLDWRAIPRTRTRVGKKVKLELFKPVFKFSPK